MPFLLDLPTFSPELTPGALYSEFSLLLPWRVHFPFPLHASRLRAAQRPWNPEQTPGLRERASPSGARHARASSSEAKAGLSGATQGKASSQESSQKPKKVKAEGARLRLIPHRFAQPGILTGHIFGRGLNFPLPVLCTLSPVVFLLRGDWDSLSGELCDCGSAR